MKIKLKYVIAIVSVFTLVGWYCSEVRNQSVGRSVMVSWSNGSGHLSKGVHRPFMLLEPFDGHEELDLSGETFKYRSGIWEVTEWNGKSWVLKPFVETEFTFESNYEVP